MSRTRDNHYVPQWYQSGFLEDGRDKLAYLRLQPELHEKPDGTKVPGRSRLDWTTTQCFRERDLYTTSFLDIEVNDEIERMLFGEIDRRGAPAVEAFKNADLEGWIDHFENFFEFMDAQKLRTPKGLAWLRRHYPFIGQNQLMFEMQGVRMMHCTLWSECVREIVFADESAVKFITSDHPVTVYNHAVGPRDPRCAFPEDPQIAWKASQTIYPLDRNHCLILTNLEYAQDPDLVDPCRKRTNARNFGNTLINADAFIRSRKLSEDEVVRINHVIKARANRFVAAGRREWLYPEHEVDTDWAALRTTLAPPDDELWRFGGEIYIGYDDGRVDYQDQFGRSEPRAPFLDKAPAEHPKAPKDFCGCGSPVRYKDCCFKRPAELRPSWRERSIRERNIMHANAIANITGLAQHGDWVKVRKELTDEKIAKIYSVFKTLWPLDTDLISLLPKPDGRLRSLFTGLIDPRMVTEFAMGAPAYFGEMLMQNPFAHASCVQPKSRPTENPAHFRQQVLKDMVLLFDMMPLIDAGIINLFPDPCFFDQHLRRQMRQMAEERWRYRPTPVADARTQWLPRDDFQRSLWGASERTQRSMIARALPDLSAEEVDELIRSLKEVREHDPLAPLHPEGDPIIPEGGLLILQHMTPNLELTMFLALATGSIIVTDSPHRWNELAGMANQVCGQPASLLTDLTSALAATEHLFLRDAESAQELHATAASVSYRSLIHDVARHLAAKDRKQKPNWESQLSGRLARADRAIKDQVRKADAEALEGKIRCMIPSGGIRDNTINRLLLMSSVDHYAETVPMAFFLERPQPSTYRRGLFGELR